MPASGEKQMRDTWTMPGELSQISEAVEKGGAATVILEKPVEAAPLRQPKRRLPSISISTWARRRHLPSPHRRRRRQPLPLRP
jgi:hypothetical protein